MVMSLAKFSNRYSTLDEIEYKSSSSSLSFKFY